MPCVLPQTLLHLGHNINDYSICAHFLPYATRYNPVPQLNQAHSLALNAKLEKVLCTRSKVETHEIALAELGNTAKCLTGGSTEYDIYIFCACHPENIIGVYVPYVLPSSFSMAPSVGGNSPLIRIDTNKIDKASLLKALRESASSAEEIHCVGPAVQCILPL